MVYPLPIERIRAFAAKVDRLYVIEELDPFIETAMRAAGIAIAGGKDRTGLLGELSQYPRAQGHGRQACRRPRRWARTCPAVRR